MLFSHAVSQLLCSSTTVSALKPLVSIEVICLVFQDRRTFVLGYLPLFVKDLSLNKTQGVVITCFYDNNRSKCKFGVLCVRCKHGKF